jgi:phosphoserine/homoserine phosphotransferase
MVFAIDLEGVLAPEIWPALGRRFDLPDLALTTRETGDLAALMDRRIAATRAHGLTLADLRAAASAIEPEPGAAAFLAGLRSLGQVLVLSDTFHELAEPLAHRLGGHDLFANRFEVDPDGRLRGYRLRVGGRKERLVAGMREAGFPVAAMGDSLNDLSILRWCDAPVLYRPVAALVAALPAAPVAHDLATAGELLEQAHQRLDGWTP